MRTLRRSKSNLTDEIVGRLARRHSTAVVLFHHAVAERLGLGPTDHKCLDLLREQGTLSGSDLSAITGLTSGAITGVVARLERAGYLQRETDPGDQRKQILSPVPERLEDLGALLAPLRVEVAAFLDSLDAVELSAIAQFLELNTEAIQRHAALLRSHTLLERRRAPGAAGEGKGSYTARKPEA